MNEFKIAQPHSIGQVTSFLSKKQEDCYLMAGGTDLLGELKSGIVKADVIVDLKTIPELSFIKKEKDKIRIGALTPVSELAQNSLIKNEYPVLHQAGLSLATPQLRNVGTAGGNLCQRPRCWYYRDPQILCLKKGGHKCFAFNGRNKYHAILGGGPCFIVYPSDLAPALISLGAEVIIASSKEEKTIPLEEFYVLPRENLLKENILKPGEILKEIQFPLKASGEKNTYLKLKERGTWDFALVSAAVNAQLTGDTAKEIRIALGGVAPIPWRAKKAESMIRGNRINQDLLQKAVQEELKDAEPLQENGYKTELFQSVMSQAVLSLINP